MAERRVDPSVDLMAVLTVDSMVDLLADQWAAHWVYPSVDW